MKNEVGPEGVSWLRWMLLVGLTAVFIGYFQVWLPGPAAGLRLIGLEMGEWIKFLGVGGLRDWFYVPPITLALMLVALSFPAAPGWQPWLLRGVACLISLLTFPAIEDITGPARSQYLLRVALIGAVVAAALLTGLLARRMKTQVARMPQWMWLLLLVVAMIGLVGPLWVYGQLRPFLTDVLQVPLAVGPGLWLNTMGHGLVAVVAVTRLRPR